MVTKRHFIAYMICQTETKNEDREKLARDLYRAWICVDGIFDDQIRNRAFRNFFLAVDSLRWREAWEIQKLAELVEDEIKSDTKIMDEITTVVEIMKAVTKYAPTVDFEEDYRQCVLKTFLKSVSCNCGIEFLDDPQDLFRC